MVAVAIQDLAAGSDGSSQTAVHVRFLDAGSNPTAAMDLDQVNELARRFGRPDSPATPEERALMRTLGPDRDPVVVRARALGVQRFIERRTSEAKAKFESFKQIMARRQRILDSPRWEQVRTRITNRSVLRLLTETEPDRITTGYLDALTRAVGIASAITREVTYIELNARALMVMGDEDWSYIRQGLPPTVVEMLNLPRPEGLTWHYLDSLRHAVTQAEAAQRRFLEPFGAGGPAVSSSTAKRQAAQRKAKQARTPDTAPPRKKG